MGLSYINKQSEKFNTIKECRDNPIDVWKDILSYSSNLNGNWMFSKEIFYNRLVPTAEKNPELFARWIRIMVKKSGVKIKSRSEYLEALKYLRSIKNRNARNKIRRILYTLLNSGIEEPSCISRILGHKCA
ncbi:MAG: hypothetical protein GX568_10615 [Candidatus Gastranaerophilales bacterium]|nr:hypothetical protein [Candidatus Gastranaerophilales bacterium]